MAMELVTGYAGKAHVTSYQDAAIQAGIVGVDNGVLSYVGQGMKAVATSANNIRIYDGVALIGGKAVVIDRDTYQDVAIANGTVGKYRNDIIYIKYTKDAFTGVESVTFDVKQGAAGNSGIDPALTTNNLYSTGTLTSEIPFKRVRLNGLAIESVENMHDNVPSLTELNRNLSEGFSPLTSDSNGIYRHPSGLMLQWGIYPSAAMTKNDGVGGYLGKIKFKESFAGTPQCFTTCHYWGGNTQTGTQDISSASVTLYSKSAATDLGVRWLALGSWK
ncbi:hypothetical protein [[Clostridium] scindens]|uniref:hypothetical protein n=1 Tax=Clostridium scindens (strain JCM 10418 / VPI 12708) TaxID=29347 RepID=UPI002B298115|nr:hypothetical protein PBLEJBOC_01829 [[Clostridium] scindens]